MLMENKIKKEKVRDHFIILRVTENEKKKLIKLAGKKPLGHLLRKALNLPLRAHQEED